MIRKSSTWSKCKRPCVLNVAPSTNYIQWYHLRSFDRINAPYESFIKKMEEKSGILFNKARVALARKFIGKIDETLIQDKGSTKSFVTPTDDV
jgi:hypothetical protein